MGSPLMLNVKSPLPSMLPAHGLPVTSKVTSVPHQPLVLLSTWLGLGLG